MRPRTDTVPKALLPVAGQPFAYWQLRWLSGQGVRRVIFSVGHLGLAIEEYVGDGSRWGLEIQFVDESPRLLGTAGALRLVADSGLLDDTFFVVYGDSYLRLKLDQVEDVYRESKQPALMTVILNDNRWDISNVEYAEGRVIVYEKYRGEDRETLRFIDYGLSILSRKLIEDLVPPGEFADLAAILAELSAGGQLAGFEAAERFYEIGSPQGLRDLEVFLAEVAPEDDTQDAP
jgi:NDP-sugar pyrophosphorylase family protein